MVDTPLAPEEGIDKPEHARQLAIQRLKLKRDFKGMVAGGAGLFGYADALQLRGGASAVHAMLLLIGIGLLALSAWQIYRHHPVSGLAAAVVAVGVLLWFFLTDQLPREIVTYSPHITTLLVLAFAAQRLRMPAADGMRYRKGEGH